MAMSSGIQWQVSLLSGPTCSTAESLPFPDVGRPDLEPVGMGLQLTRGEAHSGPPRESWFQTHQDGIAAR